MISFIIIGRNEGWKLSKCFDSVFETINRNKLSKYEVLYVDSKSTDDSVNRALMFNLVNVIKLTGDVNAAIARNIGAKESKGDVLFFIDGDMEIQPEFLSLVYEENNGLIANFVSGNWENFYYDINGKLLNKSLQYNITNDITESTTGGLFLIKKQIWDQIGGMDPVFYKSQDIDIGLRLSKKGIKLMRRKEIAAKHHTIAYLDKNRMWKDLFKGNELFGRSLLYRKHFFNLSGFIRLLRNDYLMVFLFFSLLIFIITGWWAQFIAYLFLVILRSKGSFRLLLYYILRDFSSLMGIFLFFPSLKKKTEYIIVR